LAKDSEVTGKPLQFGRTYHRTLRKTKAMGNHPGKYVICETGFAATPFCDVDMPSYLEYHP